MLMKDFYKKLQKLVKSKKYRCFLDGDDAIRFEGVACEYCPLTVLCNDEKDEIYETCEWDIAAKSLGIRKREAERIIKAADNNGGGKVRKKLLDICKPEKDPDAYEY